MTPTAIVTGASGGIGRACVRELAPDHDVLIHYHTNRDAAESLADEVTRATGSSLVSYGCDVSSPEEVRSMVDHARTAYGGVDVLVNNAGTLVARTVPEMTPDHIERMLSVNLKGAMYCSQAVLSDMRERGEGRIVNVASIAGTRGNTFAPAYAAAKGGMIAFTKTLARMYTAEGVLSNVVAPSGTDTPMYPDSRREEGAASFPQGRMVQPEEVAEAVRFFATASYVSGKVLEVDGGKYT